MPPKPGQSSNLPHLQKMVAHFKPGRVNYTTLRGSRAKRGMVVMHELGGVYTWGLSRGGIYVRRHV